jgi:archaellum component FlaF (FlaF/FlaG flagellin family)
MKMKKILAAAAILIIAILLTVNIAESQSSTDYKVIKNAVKKNGSTGKDLIFHLTVTGNDNEDSVEIEIPFNVVEYLVESCKDADINLEGKKAFKLREAIEKLKKAGPMMIIEINDLEDTGTIKIWLE